MKRDCSCGVLTSDSLFPFPYGEVDVSSSSPRIVCKSQSFEMSAGTNAYLLKNSFTILRNSL